MLKVQLDEEWDSLLRQTAADLDIPPDEVAKVLLESSLMLSLTR
jgi:hypothetical protein